MAITDPNDTAGGGLSIASPGPPSELVSWKPTPLDANMTEMLTLKQKTLEMKLSSLQKKFVALEERFDRIQDQEATSEGNWTGKITDVSDGSVCIYGI